MKGWSAELVRVLLCSWLCMASGIGVNWGLQASHPLPRSTVVRMLRDNGIQKVKLFDAEGAAMTALANSGIQVMVGIPNDMLAGLAASESTAASWVSNNVSKYINDGVDIRYVAVGNEPFLESFNGSYLQTTYPAMKNIQTALIAAGLGNQVKVTVPLNADVYGTTTNAPSGGDFRTDIHDLMLIIVKFLNDNVAPFTVNIYPFISLYDNPNFPIDYAFFDGSTSPVVDGSITYTNVFDANHDTLVAALNKNGYGNLSIIVGEVGWPTDGDMHANQSNAQKFNQGFINHISTGNGTPLRPGPIDAYLFSLIDEDEKSIQPGNFERHWGIFAYDGTTKYSLNLLTSSSGGLVAAKNVKYLDKKWCVLKSSVSLSDSQVAPSVSYACALADCSSLGYLTSCGDLDARGNISYAYNSYYQKNDQDYRACDFSGLAITTDIDPSTSTCRFEIMIDIDFSASPRKLQNSLMGQILCAIFFVLVTVL